MEGRRKSPINQFKEKLQEIKNNIILNNKAGSTENEKQKKWKKQIVKQIKGCESKYIKKAWEQLLNVLNYYQNKSSNKIPEILKERNTLPPKTFSGYINEIENNPKSLFADGAESKKGACRKIASLKNLSNRDLFHAEEEKKYKKVLSYYLAVKMIRNHVNHANGITGDRRSEEKKEDFKMAMCWLKEKAEIEINFDFDENTEEVGVEFDNIIKLLRSGVKESKSLFSMD